MGPTARCVALLARKTWADPAGAAAMLAGAKRRPSRASGGRGRASRRGRDPFSGRPLEPVSPASRHGVCRRPSHRGRAGRRAHPARGSPLVCLCRRRRGGHQRLCRPWAGPAGPHAAPLALSCAPLSCRSGQLTQKAHASRPSAEDGGTRGLRPLSARRVPRGRGSPRRGAGVDGPGHDAAVGGVDGCRDTPGVSGATYPRGTRLSLAQKPGGPQSGVAGETRTDCRLGDAHGGGVARVCRAPTAGSPLSPRPSPTNPRE
jgi:hypothetical protein